MKKYLLLLLFLITSCISVPPMAVPDTNVPETPADIQEDAKKEIPDIPEIKEDAQDIMETCDSEIPEPKILLKRLSVFTGFFKGDAGKYVIQAGAAGQSQCGQSSNKEGNKVFYGFFTK
jgi:hypothetical protein